MDRTTNDQTYADCLVLLLQQANYLNNQGVAALAVSGRQGNEHAIVAFRKSLRILQDLATQVGDNATGLEIIGNFKLHNAARIPQLRDEAFHIYDQPKMFFPDPKHAFSITHVTAFSATVILNTAIAYHRQAVSTKTSKHFVSSQKLYKACAHLCSSLLSANSNNEAILLLYLACVNNLAHVQNWLLERNDLAATLTLLHQLVAKVAQGPENVTILQEISLNVTMGAGYYTAASAA